MRLALFSDIHGDFSGLQAALAFIDRQTGINAVYALGDHVGGPDDGRTLDLLAARDVRMLRGNWDEFVLDIEGTIQFAGKPELARRIVAESRACLSSDHLALLAGLPLEAVVEPEPGRRALLCHAAPGNPHSLFFHDAATTETLRAVYGGADADVVMYGHYHGHHVIALDGKLLVNVASIGMRDDGLTALTLLEYDGHWAVRQLEVPCKR